eukprot:3176197-Ditylum_brightwellii.AAC.1
MPVEKRMTDTHKGVNTKYISPASRAKLMEINTLDYRLYIYALKRLISQAQECSLVDPTTLRPALERLR